ncbi:hypothetical protein [Ideonella dechloratans]|uniref:hypothetical protein n=1 Tax=Ideonella dechloratans TaxID=36863 RepID=UPI0035B16241
MDLTRVLPSRRPHPVAAAWVLYLGMGSTALWCAALQPPEASALEQHAANLPDVGPSGAASVTRVCQESPQLHKLSATGISQP